MPDTTATWSMIHTERAGLADTIEALTEEQWQTPSLCAGWTVGFLAGHILSSAEQTPGHFLGGMVTTGFRFSALMERDARARADLTPAQVADRLRERTSTTNRPPAPVAAMLGEVVVHGADLRVPLGLDAPLDAEAANVCLDMYAKASFPVGGKKRISGLQLRSTDTGWTYGEGPLVTGPAESLLLGMTGRAAGLDRLSGDGAAVLAQRVVGAARAA
jgi:uncharacterized protein (TIGR03083 family)